MKEINNIIPNKYSKVIDNIIGRNFPWFTDPIEKTTDHHYPSFYHIVLRRPEEGDRINSDLYTPLKNMFEEIAKKHNIKYKEFGRIGINCTFHEKEKWGKFHVDHAYPNKSLLIFLNSFDEGSFFITSKKYNKKLGTDIGAKKPICNNYNGNKKLFTFSFWVVLGFRACHRIYPTQAQSPSHPRTCPLLTPALHHVGTSAHCAG